jgi:hypothetical protein
LNYPILYDATEVQFQSFGLAILENASEVKIVERLDGEFSLSLNVPYDTKLKQVIDDAEYIKVDNIVFCIRRITFDKSTSGTIEASIEAEHIKFELINSVVDNKQYIGQTLQHILNDLLPSGKFQTASWIDDFVGYDFEVLELKNVYQCIYDLAQSIGGEVECSNMPNFADKFEIGIRVPQYSSGTYTGGGRGSIKENLHLRIGKNIKSIKKEIDKTEYRTKVFYYGKDGRQFDNHTITFDEYGNPLNPVDYITMPLGESYFEVSAPKQRIGFKEFSDIENLDELYWASKIHFQSVNKPKINFDIAVVDIKSLPEFEYDFENFGIGDVVKFFSDELSEEGEPSQLVRVTEYERMPYEPEKSKARFESIQRNIFLTFADFVKTKQVVDSLTLKGNQTINPAKLDGVYIETKKAIDDGFNAEYSGHMILGQMRDGMLISLNNQGNKGALFFNENGDILLFNSHGAGISIKHQNSAVPQIRATSGTLSNIVSDATINASLETNSTLNNMKDVGYIGTPTTNSVLSWNGTIWTPTALNTLLEADSTLNRMKDVAYTVTPQVNMTLKWNGTNWIPSF